MALRPVGPDRCGPAFPPLCAPHPPSLADSSDCPGAPTGPLATWLLDVRSSSVLELRPGGAPRDAVRTPEVYVGQAWRKAEPSHDLPDENFSGMMSAENDFWDNSDILCTQVLRGNLQSLVQAQADGCTWDTAYPKAAASFGHLSCLQFLHDAGCPWDWQTTRKAALNGHLACLKYACEHGCALHPGIAAVACRGGNADCLQYLLAFGCKLEPIATVMAAQKGDVQCMRLAHEAGCPWGDQTLTQAAGFGHLDCLVYAHQNGCPWQADTLAQAWGGGQGLVDCLRYAHQNGACWHANTVLAHCNQECLESVQYAVDHGAPCSPPDLLKAAASKGNAAIAVLAVSLGAVPKAGELAMALRSVQGLKQESLLWHFFWQCRYLSPVQKEAQYIVNRLAQCRLAAVKGLAKRKCPKELVGTICNLAGFTLAKVTADAAFDENTIDQYEKYVSRLQWLSLTHRIGRNL